MMRFTTVPDMSRSFRAPFPRLTNLVPIHSKVEPTQRSADVLVDADRAGHYAPPSRPFCREATPAISPQSTSVRPSGKRSRGCVPLGDSATKPGTYHPDADFNVR